MSALREEIERLGLEPELAARFEEYLDLLMRWNRRHNLSGFQDPRQLVVGGVADSLAGVALLPGHGPVMDVGSGAGFPAIPMILATGEDREWTLLEPRRKRAAFLGEACRVLGLARVRIERGRLEQAGGEYAVATSRGIRGIAAAVRERLRPGGCWVYVVTPDERAHLQTHGGHEGLALDAEHPFEGLHGPACWVRLRRV